MIKNLINDRFLLITSLEMIVLSIFMSYVQNLFVEPDNFKFILIHAQDPIMNLILIAVGTFGIVVSAYNIRIFHAHRCALVMLVATWSAYLAVFAWHDIHVGNPIGLTNYFILFVIVRVLGELKFGKLT